MGNSEDKTRPQEHGGTTNPAQDQSVTIVPTSSQNSSNEDQSRSPQQKRQSQPPREERVTRLQASGSVTQELWNGIVAIFTVLLCIVTYWQFQLGQEQNQLGRETFKFTQANERPWVSAEIEIPHPLVFDKEGNLGMEVVVAVKNVGRAVAQETWVWAELTFLDPDGENTIALRRQQEMCGIYRNPPGPRGDTIGFVLFPEEDPARFTIKTGMWKKEIASELARALPANKGKVGFVIIGCVSYRAASEDPSQQRHQTRFLYHVSVWDDETEKSNVFMRPSGGPYDTVLLRQRHGSSAD